MQASMDTCAHDCLPRTQPLRVILINLDRSTDRLARMQAEFERVGVSFERFPAVSGTDLPESVKPYFCDAAGKVVSPLRSGEIGCYASHLGVWQRIAAGHCGVAALVCEDDVGLPDDLIPLLARLLKAAPSGWDVIRLSSNTRRPVAAVAPLGAGRNLVRYWRGPPLSGAYLVSRAGASKLLQPKLRHLPVDEDLARPWLFDLDAYGVLPAPVAQEHVFASMIEAEGGREHALGQRTRRARKSEHFNRHAYNMRTMGLRDWLRCFAASRASRLGRRKDEGPSVCADRSQSAACASDCALGTRVAFTCDHSREGVR